MKSLRLIGLGILVTSLNAGGLCAQSAGRLAARVGQVEVLRDGRWAAIMAGDLIALGEKLATAAGSSAAIELSSGQVVTVSPNSQVEVADIGGIPGVRQVRGRMHVMQIREMEVPANDPRQEALELLPEGGPGDRGNTVNVFVVNGPTGPADSEAILGAKDLKNRGYESDWLRPFHGVEAGYPIYYIYPFVSLENPRVKTLPPTGYSPRQIVPPMIDPIRPPVLFPVR